MKTKKTTAPLKNLLHIYECLGLGVGSFVVVRASWRDRPWASARASAWGGYKVRGNQVPSTRSRAPEPFIPTISL